MLYTRRTYERRTQFSNESWIPAKLPDGKRSLDTKGGFDSVGEQGSWWKGADKLKVRFLCASAARHGTAEEIYVKLPKEFRDLEDKAPTSGRFGTECCNTKCELCKKMERQWSVRVREWTSPRTDRRRRRRCRVLLLPIWLFHPCTCKHKVKEFTSQQQRCFCFSNKNILLNHPIKIQ